MLHVVYIYICITVYAPYTSGPTTNHNSSQRMSNAVHSIHDNLFHKFLGSASDEQQNVIQSHSRPSRPESTAPTPMEGKIMLIIFSNRV